MSSMEALLKDESTRNVRRLLKVLILITIAGAAVSSRLFSVIRKLLPHKSPFVLKIVFFPRLDWRIGANCNLGFESIIHECRNPPAI